MANAVSDKPWTRMAMPRGFPGPHRGSGGMRKGATDASSASAFDGSKGTRWTRSSVVTAAT